MTEATGTEALVMAVRADTKADGAHERLDRMNGSIDKLTREVAGANTAIANAKGELSAKLDGVLLQLAHASGMKEGEAAIEKSLLERHRFAWTTLVAAFSAIVTALITLYAYGKL